MERLLADAENLTGVHYDINNLSDVYNAIHAIQDNLHITGTTAQEAEHTLTGSFDMMKAAAQDFAGSLALGQNIEPEMVKVASSVQAFLSNLLPAVGNIFNALPQMAHVGAQLINNLATSIQQNLPQLIPAAMQTLVSFSSSLRQNVGQLVDAGLNLITALAQSFITNIPVFVATIPALITNLAGIINDNAPKLLTTGVQLLGQLALGLIQAIPTLVANIPAIIQAIVAVFTAFNWLSLGKNIFTALKNGLKSVGPALKAAATNIKNGIVNAIRNLPSLLMNLGRNAGSFLANGIRGMMGLIRAAATAILRAIVSAIQSLPSKLLTLGRNAVSRLRSAFTGGNWGSIGRNIINGIVSGVAGAAGRLFSKMRSLASGALNAAKKALGIASPSKLMRDEIGKWIPAGIAVGIDTNEKVLQDSVGNMLDLRNLGVKAVNTSPLAVTGGESAARNITYNQTINSPKALTRREIIRQTRNTARELTAYAH